MAQERCAVQPEVKFNALIDEMTNQPATADGHEWKLSHSHVKSRECWVELSRRCSNEALLELKGTPCLYGPFEPDEDFKGKQHLSHDLVQRGAHVACAKCKKHSLFNEGRRGAWLAVVCNPFPCQRKLHFWTSSSPQSVGSPLLAKQRLGRTP